MRNNFPEKQNKNRKKAFVRCTLLLAVFVIYAVLATHFLGHACPINLVFGVPCPGCGLTRAVLLLFRGDFFGAFSMHPLVFALPVIAGLLIAAIFSERFSRSKVFTALCFFFVALFIGVYVYRMIAFFPSKEPTAFNENSLLFFLKRLFESVRS